MKFLRFDDWATGLLFDGSTGPRVLDVASSLARFRSHDAAAAESVAAVLPDGGSGSWVPLIENWDRVRGALQKMLGLASQGDRTGLTVVRPLDSVRLRPPLATRHPRILALGANVAAHASAAFKVVFGTDVPPEHFLKEKRDGLPPWGFLVVPETVVGPGEAVSPPAGVQKFDYEGEIAVILKTGGRRMRPDDIAFWGYTAWNDFSIRDGRLGIGLPLHRGAFSWALEKNFETGNACGPWVVVDEPYDLGRLRCTLRVNGETRQDWSTLEMIYDFRETAEFLSRYFALAPGDMICSGTGAGTAVEGGRDGTRWLRPGDRVEVEVEGVGILRNDVAKW